MDERVRLQSNLTGLYIKVGATACVANIVSASTFHIRDDIVRHRGKLVTLKDGALGPASTTDAGLIFRHGQLRSGKYAIVSLSDGALAWTGPDDVDIGQQFTSHIIRSVPMTSNPVPLADVTLAVASMSTMKASRRMTRTERLHEASETLRSPDIGIYVLFNVDEHVLVALMHMHTFPNSTLGPCQILTEGRAQCAVVYDPIRFEARRAVEISRGGGIIAMLRSKTLNFDFVLACLMIDATQSDNVHRHILAHVDAKVNEWPPTRQRIVVFPGGVVPSMNNRLTLAKWTRAESSMVNLFCTNFIPTVLAATVELTFMNGTTQRGTVDTEYEHGLFFAFKGRTTWVPRSAIRSLRRGVSDSQGMQAPIICALHRIRA